MRPQLLAPLVVVVGFALVGCSKNAGNAAEQLIVDELQSEIGLGPLTPSCGQPSAYDAGETFTCTATTADDRVVEFVGVMTDDDTFSLNTSNLLTAPDVVEIRRQGAELLGAELGVTIGPDDIACPAEIVLLDATGDFECEITDTQTGDVFTLVVSTGGIEPGVGVRTLEFVVGDQLR